MHVVAYAYHLPVQSFCPEEKFRASFKLIAHVRLGKWLEGSVKNLIFIIADRKWAPRLLAQPQGRNPFYPHTLDHLIATNNN